MKSVWLCGISKESLLHAVFYLDHDAGLGKELKELKASYEPHDKREIWVAKKYVGSECKELYGLPKGKHVLSIKNSGNKTIELSHVIMWP